MAFNELDLKRIERAMDAFMLKRRPPSHVRHQMDLGYRVEEQSVELFTVRPVWKDPSRTAQHAFAKATFVRSQNEWRLYWMRGNLKWHAYEPGSARTIEDILMLIDDDRSGCFFG